MREPTSSRRGQLQTGAGGGRPERRFAPALAEIVLWWAAGTVFWLATASTITAVEAAVAALVSLVGAVLARMARRAMPFELTVRRVWLRWAAMVPVAAVADALRLARWLPGEQPAEVREGHLPADQGPAGVGWRAGGVVALSATPGSVVVDADPASGRVLVHSLADGWPGLGQEVLRVPQTGE